MAAYMAGLGSRPDLILCSTAVRARQTLAPLLDRLAPAPAASLETGLYLASEETLLERLQALPAEVAAVVVIGHNDGIWELATRLAGTGSGALLGALRERYPTGALAILEASVERWQNLAAGGATLTAFVCPRHLGADGKATFGVFDPES